MPNFISCKLTSASLVRKGLREWVLPSTYTTTCNELGFVPRDEGKGMPLSIAHHRNIVPWTGCSLEKGQLTGEALESVKHLWLLRYLHRKEKSSFRTNCCSSFWAGSRMAAPADVFSPRGNPRLLDVSRTSLSNKWDDMSSWYYWHKICRSKDVPQAYSGMESLSQGGAHYDTSMRQDVWKASDGPWRVRRVWTEVTLHGSACWKNWSIPAFNLEMVRRPPPINVAINWGAVCALLSHVELARAWVLTSSNVFWKLGEKTLCLKAEVSDDKKYHF